MTKRGVLVVGALVFGGAVLFAVPVLMFVVSLGSMSENEGGCGRAGSTNLDVRPVAAAASALNEAQRRNASVVISTGYQLGIPRRGIIIALAVASQESRFVNYANDGQGGDLTWLQAGIDSSLALPHEGVATDHGSLGVFQQQWPSWGSMESLLDPARAAQKFYFALQKVPDWQSLPVTVAAQAVQISAFPDAYTDDVPLAKSLLDDPSMANAADVSSRSMSTAPGDCFAARVAPGTVSFPLPADARYVDQRNWGASGGRWSRGHTGTDFSAACGTPVLAATGGTVIVRTDQPWSGPWLVQVTTGIGQLTTWYGHMKSLAVEDGDRVEAGAVIGTVGSEGNSSGCHLHFEVHPRGGTIYEDGINPSGWLRQNVGRDLADDSASTSGGEFVLATFNVLGHSHTTAGGNKRGWDPSSVRMRRTVRMLDRYAVDVIGLQELQRPQAHAFRAVAGGTYELHSPPGDTENSIAWRRSRWEFVAADTVAIPYFNGRIRHMPVVRLRDRSTNQDSMFINVHNPADTSRFPRQERYRRVAVERERALIEELRTRYQLPVYLTGDLNDRRSAFCDLTEGSLMVAAAGGRNQSSCQPPESAGIDWVLGTAGVQFTDHRVIRDSSVRVTSDHPFVFAHVKEF